jgi:hypothetical protein
MTREPNMIKITSQPYPEDLIGGPEMREFLYDLEKYATNELEYARKFAFFLMQLKRFTREELKAIIGHTDHMLKERRKNAPTNL